VNDSAEPLIDWGAADIDEGVLSVTLKGDIPKGWSRRFSSLVSLLEQGSSGWGEIAIHKSTITVADIQQGSEDDLRHLLESVVMQANADFEQPESSAPDTHTDTEHAIVDRFRSFSSAGDGE
jgi:hypothetical protein